MAMPAKHNATKGVRRTTRGVVFISKAAPENDDFVLWLAPHLEAAGYIGFADILNIDPGDRWLRKVTDTLQNPAVSMLLWCPDSKRSTMKGAGLPFRVAREENAC